MQMSSIRLPLNLRPLSWMTLKIWRDNWRPLILDLQIMVSSHSRYHLVSPFRSPLQIEWDWSSLSYSVQLPSRGSTDNPPKVGKKTIHQRVTGYWLLTLIRQNIWISFLFVLNFATQLVISVACHWKHRQFVKTSNSSSNIVKKERKFEFCLCIFGCS